MKYLVCKIMTDSPEDNGLSDLGLPIEPVYADFCVRISSIDCFEDFFNEEDEKAGTMIKMFDGSHVITTMPFREVLEVIKKYESHDLLSAFN